MNISRIQYICNDSFGVFLVVLGGSWLVISGVISTVTIVITHIRAPPLITTHEPRSRVMGASREELATGRLRLHRQEPEDT